MVKHVLTVFSCLLLTACFWGDELHNETHITHNIWLKWWGEENDQHLLKAFDNDPSGGSYLLGPVVFAVGNNNDFIIAKQHPDMESEISKRLFKYSPETGDYELENPADTVYIATGDSIYTRNGKWYHISNGWNPPDSLKPYRTITYYHIIDLRKYKDGNNDYQKHTFDNEPDFRKAKKKLGVPDDLDFTIVSHELE